MDPQLEDGGPLALQLVHAHLVRMIHKFPGHESDKFLKVHLALQQISDVLALLFQMATQQAADGVGRERPVVHPVLHAILLEDNTRGGSPGIIGPQDLEKASISFALNVGRHDSVEGTLLLAVSGQPDLYRHIHSSK